MVKPVAGRRKRRQALSPLLEKILSDRSNVVFNVPKKAVACGRSFFHVPRFNKAIIFKYPRFDVDIGDYVASGSGGGAQERPVETCLYFPYDSARAQDGGQGIYLREFDFEEKIRYFVGSDVNENSQEMMRDMVVLQIIDDIPSLDPFLMKVKFDDEQVEIDQHFLALDPNEELAIRSIITRDIYPIIAKAFPTSITGGSSKSISDLIDNLWKPQSPEASMFIEAFQIDRSLAGRVLMAWKGIAYYEYKFAENTRKSVDIIRWLQSRDSDPYDLASIGQLKEMFMMRRQAVVKQLRDVTTNTVSIFNNYRKAHTAFLTNNDPTGFRDFLLHANQRFWALGFCVNALDHCNYLFESEVLDKPGMKLRYEQTDAFLAKISATVERSINPESQLG